MDIKEMKRKEMKMMLWQAWCERSAGSSDTFLTIYIRAQAVPGGKGQQQGDRAGVKETHGATKQMQTCCVSPRGSTSSDRHVCIRTAQVRLETLPLLSRSRSRVVELDRERCGKGQQSKGCYEKDKKKKKVCSPLQFLIWSLGRVSQAQSLLEWKETEAEAR